MLKTIKLGKHVVKMFFLCRASQSLQYARGLHCDSLRGGCCLQGLSDGRFRGAAAEQAVREAAGVGPRVTLEEIKAQGPDTHPGPVTSQSKPAQCSGESVESCVGRLVFQS